MGVIWPSQLTFFDDMLKVGHALNVRPGNIFVLAKDRIDFAAEFLEHMWVSHKKAATVPFLAANLAV